MKVELSKLVHKCAEVEQAMAELYLLYMQRYPDDADFWEGLYNEELRHIAFLVNGDMFDAFGDRLDQIPLPSEAFVDRARSSAFTALDQARQRSVPLEEALYVVLNLEESVVESFVGEALEGDLDGSPFMTLISDTRSHADMLRNFMRRKGFIKIS